jgi:6-phosphogluconolactonase (cycloisomerase 2 family)
MLRIAPNFAARGLVLICLSVVLLHSCRGIEGTGGIPSPPSAGPAIALYPNCVPRGEPSGYFNVIGQNFPANSVVRWNGSDLPTTFVDSTKLTAQFSASNIAAVGTAVVTVFNPGTGGGNSNTAIFTINAGAVGPNSIAVDPAGQFAYVANEGCGNSTDGYVSMYTIDTTTGNLTSVGPPVPTNDEGADSVAVSPNGKFVYVANWGEGDTAGSLSAFTIDATTGALTSLVPAYCELPPNPCLAPYSVAVDPSGKFAYAANEGGPIPTSVSMYTINPTTGALTSTGIIAASARASFVAVDPSGRFAYVAEGYDSTFTDSEVSMYTINPTTGTLTSAGTVAAGLGAISIAVHPSGKFAYVTNSGSNDVAAYSLNSATGALASTGTIAAGSGPASIAIHPSGTFAYVANRGSNDVSTYEVDRSTGSLAPRGTINAGSAPTSIVIHPSGKFAYVTNSGSNDVWEYSIDAITGALTLIGSIGT